MNSGEDKERGLKTFGRTFGTNDFFCPEMHFVYNALCCNVIQD